MDKINVNKKYLIVSIVSVLLLAIGLSFAYWRATIVGEGKSITVTVDKLKIIFTDDREVTLDNARPGWTITKTFSVKNESANVFKYNISLDNMINSLVTKGYLKYKIESSDKGAYNSDGYEELQSCTTTCSQVLAADVSIDPGATQNYTIEFVYENDPVTDQSEDMGKLFKGRLTIEDTRDKTIADYFIKLYSDAQKRDDSSFSSVVTEGNVYYEDGDYTEYGSKVIYWAGSGHDKQDAYIGNGNIYANPIGNPLLYVGYKYGEDGTLEDNRKNDNDSTIKGILDNWYTDTIEANDLDKYISKTAIYCNDRSGDGYKADSAMYFAAYNRLYNKKHPSFKCGLNTNVSDTPSLYNDGKGKEDKFSTPNEDHLGNELLDKPVALMTADEVAFAGGVYEINNESAYYFRNSLGESATGNIWWWTMTPYNFSGVRASLFLVDGSEHPGYLAYAYVDNNVGLSRPVLSLKGCVTLTGEGTTENPYVPYVSETCESADN